MHDTSFFSETFRFRSNILFSASAHLTVLRANRLDAQGSATDTDVAVGIGHVACVVV